MAKKSKSKSTPLLMAVAEQLGGNETKARGLILAGQVFVDNQKKDKPGMAVKSHQKVMIKGQKEPYASRGGRKLAGAVTSFEVPIKEKVALDIGLSTGGFTDYLLQEGARWVFGVDVSYGLCDYRIRQHPQVTLLERTNARFLTTERLIEACDQNNIDATLVSEISLVVMDVSFISVTTLLPVIKSVVMKECVYICLIKPQFEAPKAWVGDGGIIRDIEVQKQVLEQVKVKLAPDFKILNECPSPIQGTKGNQEYFFHLTAI